MSNSICLYLPEKKYNSNIKPVHFVYETEFHKMRQPFFRSIYYMHLVTKGSATLKMCSNTYKIEKGDFFFSFPACLQEVEASDDFEYLYISFMGQGAQPLLDSFGINMENPVFRGLEHLTDFWLDAINRITPHNITVLTEGVLFYSIAFMNNTKNEEFHQNANDNLLEKVVEYIDKHYRDSDMSLKKLADFFSYTEKYLSALFKKSTNTSFRHYLNLLRIQYAFNLIENGETSVRSISNQCGYSDPMYFSKVFKSIRGITPSEYLKLLKK